MLVSGPCTSQCIMQRMLQGGASRCEKAPLPYPSPKERGLPFCGVPKGLEFRCVAGVVPESPLSASASTAACGVGKGPPSEII
jgi:hypothetical protein